MKYSFLARSLFLFLPFFVSVAVGDTPITPLINKGNKSVSGTFGFTHNGIDSGSLDVLTLNPEMSYFIQDHLAVGASLSFSQKFGADSATNIGFGPSGIYYFEKLGDGWLFLKDKLDYLGVSGSVITGANRWTNTFSVGLNYFLSSSIAFGPAIEWEHNLSSGFPSNRSRETFRVTGLFSMYLE